MIRYHHCVISFSPRKWQLLKHLSLLNGFSQLHLQQDSIAYVCTFQLWYGWGWQMIWTQLNGGWKQENNQFIPIMTEKIAVPDELLKIIHCNCSGGCKSSRCSCRRHGLPCTAACGPCQTENCDNPNNTQEVDTEEEDDTRNWTLWNFFYGQRCLCSKW